MAEVLKKICEFSLDFSFDNIPKNVVHKCKQHITDSLGCAIAGYFAQDSQILLSIIQELGGKTESTIIGSGQKTTSLYATLANGLMIRVLDYNDVYWNRDPCHPSDLISAALAVGEKVGASGKELIEAIVLGYEFEIRFCDLTVESIWRKGWHHASLTQFVSPIVTGKLLKLNVEQMLNAIGISACHNYTLGEVTKGKLSMMKNLADPLAVQSGVMAAILAQKGFKGPKSILDGKQGFLKVVSKKYEVKKLVENLGKEFMINKCWLKPYPAEYFTLSAITATIELVHKYNLQYKDIEHVIIRTTSRAASVSADQEKYKPTTKETADHSLPYCVAVAIYDGDIGVEQFSEERIKNKDIISLIQKVKVVADEELDKFLPEAQPAIVEIYTKDGRILMQRVDHPKGSCQNPLTDSDVERKFQSLAYNVMTYERMDEIIKAIYKLEDITQLSDFMELLTFNHGKNINVSLNY
ncbi:MAG: MmgE/PrpD family protein [Candidatus Bathyarchaeia archaeon]